MKNCRELASEAVLLAQTAAGAQAVETVRFARGEAALMKRGNAR